MFSFPFPSPSKHKNKQRINPRRPRLERRNASKNIQYTAPATSSSPPSSPDADAIRLTRSLDLSPSYSKQTNFRIGGSIEGEIDLIYKSLGLSGPEDFAIPAAAWEACRARRSLLSPTLKDGESTARVSEDETPISRKTGVGDGGIKGLRPPSLTPLETMITTQSAPPTISELVVLAPPSSISLPEMEKMGSTWDLVRYFTPDGDQEEGRRQFELENEVGRGRLGEEVSEDVYWTSNDDDDSSSSTTTTEGMCVISPNGRFKRNIRAWMRGQSLGSGSFGTVYEGISDDGFFFAVKEVSLLDHGSDAQQCILQLEQEIALLSQFEHENIVQYYGTDKEEAKLFIFLELVTQGSLASLYQKYRLQNSQVSAYTWQILKGLNYLHERDVVHRDIKCANLLVHANGSVKLADFGLAKQITAITKLKSCKGSVYWMAPEVANPKSTYGPAADIWSLGCTVLEMLTRQVPYPNLEWQHVFFMVGRGEKPPIPSYVSRDARDFITRCVQVEPTDRPSAARLLEHPFVRRRLPCLGLGSDYSSSSPGYDRWN